mgnify:CR=1 FL=1
MQNRLTIKDIARLSGVGKSTVSRVLNNESGVSQRTRATIDGGLLRLWICEAAKWCATLGIALFYCVTGHPQRAAWLVRMRRRISAGMTVFCES